VPPAQIIGHGEREQNGGAKIAGALRWDPSQGFCRTADPAGGIGDPLIAGA